MPGTPYSQFRKALLSYVMFEIERDPYVHIGAEKLRSLDISAVIFDLDDTLIYTGELFTLFKNQYAEVVSKATGIVPDVLLKRIQELNDEEFFKVGVSHNRWYTVLDRLSQELNDDGVVKDNIDIIMQIYNKEPRVRSGAKSILGHLRTSGFKLGMVTHASVEWTERKLSQTGLFSFFDAIEIVDPNGFKTKEHWQKGMDLLGVESKNCLVVGDNLKGDIIPSVSLGAKAIWMPSPWSVYRQGVVPDNVVEMDELSCFWDAVQKLT